MQARLELRPEAGGLRRRDHAVPDRRQLRNEVAVPARVLSPHELLDERVREAHRQVRRSREDHRTGAVVKRHREVPRIGDRCDVAGLADAAAPVT